jgi:hypothetical protein
MNSRLTHRKQSILGAFAAAVGLCLTLPVSASEAPDAHQTAAPQSALVLIDANADMANAIDGSVRFDLQHQAINVLSLRNTRIGAYGGGSCKGFTLSDSGSANSFKGTEPKGRRNLASALDAALAAFPEEAPVKRVVAIVGGPNQCLAALCAHAGRLKEKFPEFIVDLIGFGLSDQTASRIDCISANTGGRFARADAATLSTALALTLRTPTAALTGLAVPESRQQPASDDQPLTGQPDLPALEAPGTYAAVVAPKPLEGGWRMTGPESFVPQGLRLMASLVQGGGPLVDGARFELLRADTHGVYRLIARTERTASPLFAVPAGRYLARVSRGGAVSEAEVWAPEAGVVTRRLALDAGQLALAALSGGRAAARGAQFRVERLDGPGPIMTISGRGRALATVPAGRYKIHATIDHANAERIVEVRPGEIVAAGLDVPLGFVRVALTFASAPGRGSGSHAPAEISIVRNGREIASAKGESPLFRLAPGPYTVIARSGLVATKSQVVADAGALVDVAMTIGQSETAALNKQLDPVLIAQQPNDGQPSTNR